MQNINFQRLIGGGGAEGSPGAPNTRAPVLLSTVSFNHRTGLCVNVSFRPVRRAGTLSANTPNFPGIFLLPANW